jgi:hypothetical protein
LLRWGIPIRARSSSFIVFTLATSVALSSLVELLK